MSSGQNNTIEYMDSRQI